MAGFKAINVPTPGKRSNSQSISKRPNPATSSTGTMNAASSSSLSSPLAQRVRLKSMSGKRKRDDSPKVVVHHSSPMESVSHNTHEEEELVPKAKKNKKKSYHMEGGDGSKKAKTSREQVVRSAKLLPSIETQGPTQMSTSKRPSPHESSPGQSADEPSDDDTFARDVGWTRATHEPDGGQYQPSQANTGFFEWELESEPDPESAGSNPSSAVRSSRASSSTHSPKRSERVTIPQTPSRTPQPRGTGRTPRPLFEARLDFSPVCPSPLIFDKDLRDKKLDERGFVEVPKAETEYLKSLRDMQLVKERHEKSMGEIAAMERQLLEKEKLMEEERCLSKGKRPGLPRPSAGSPTRGQSKKRKHNGSSSDCQKRSRSSHMHIKCEEVAGPSSVISDKFNGPAISKTPGFSQSDGTDNLRATENAQMDVAGLSGCRLHIGNLPWTTTEATLRTFFRGYTITKVIIPIQRGAARVMGWAFVHIAGLEEGQRAITKLNGKKLLGRELAVSFARKADAATEMPIVAGDRDHLGKHRPVLAEGKVQPLQIEHAPKAVQELGDSKASNLFVEKSGDGSHESKSSKNADSSSDSKQAKDATWRRQFSRREVDVPARCTCKNLPCYFKSGREDVQITSWKGQNIDFLVHAMQVSTCNGHSKDLIASCQRALQRASAEDIADAARRLDRTTESAIHFAQDFLSSRTSPESNRMITFQSQYGQRAQSSIGPVAFYGNESTSGASFFPQEPQRSSSWKEKSQNKIPTAKNDPRADRPPGTNGSPSRKKKKKKQREEALLPQCRPQEPQPEQSQQHQSPQQQPHAQEQQPPRPTFTNLQRQCLQEETPEARRKRHQSLPACITSLEKRKTTSQTSPAPTPRQVLQDLQQNRLHHLPHIMEIKTALGELLFEHKLKIVSTETAHPANIPAATNPQANDASTSTPAADILAARRAKTAERKREYPELSADVRRQDRATDERLIAIGRIKTPYQRHIKAPYAFNWCGTLRKDYEYLRNLRHGAWTEEEKKRITKHRPPVGEPWEVADDGWGNLIH